MIIQHVMDGEQPQHSTSLLTLVKPSCLRIVRLLQEKDPKFTSPSTQRQLSEALSSIRSILTAHIVDDDGSVIPSDVAEQVFFLISNLLNHSGLQNSIIEHIFTIITIFIDHCWTNNNNNFNHDIITLFPLIPFLLTNHQNDKPSDPPQLLETSSSEYQLSLVECATAIFRCSVHHSQSRAMFTKHQNAIAHFITLVIDIVTQNKTTELSVAGIKCLKIVTLQVVQDKPSVAVISPGVVSKLLKFLLENKSSRNINGAVICEVLEFVGEVVVYILANEDFTITGRFVKGKDIEKQLIELTIDGDLENPRSDSSDQLGNKKSTEFEIVDDETTPIRDSQWVKFTTDNLHQFFERLTNKYRASTNDKVKQSLLKFCDSIITKCYKTFSAKSIDILVDCELFLLGNNSGFVSDLSQATTEAFIENKLFQTLENSADSIGSALYASDQQELVGKIKTITYNVEILLRDQRQHNKSKQLESSITNLIDTMIRETIVLRNSQKSKIVKKSRIGDLTIDLETNKSFPTLANNNHRNFQSHETAMTMLMRKKNLIDEDEIMDVKELCVFNEIWDTTVETAIGDFFQMIGTFRGIANNVVETLLLNQGNSSLHKGLTLWVCNNIVNGATVTSPPTDMIDEFLNFDDDDDDDDDDDGHQLMVSKDDDRIEMAENLLGMLELSQNLLSISDDLDNSSSSSNKSSNGDIISAISLDTIATAAKFLGTDFQTELIDYLYPAIEHLASSSWMVVKHSQNTVLQLAHTVYHGSVEQLIIDNSDYLLDSLNLKLMNISFGPDTIKVLIVLMKIAGGELVEKLEDIINSSFILLDSYHGYSALTNGFFMVFNEILNTIYQQYIIDGKYEFEVLSEINNELKERSKPWGIDSIEGMFTMLDKSKRDLPNLEQLDLANEEEQDSDDEEEEEFGGSTQVDDNDDDYSKEIFKYKSPIAKPVYLLIQKIGSYCLRFLQYPSMNVRLQIFEMLNKILELLATQPVELNPVLFEFWQVVSDSATTGTQDMKINIAALRTIKVMFKFGGTFLNKHFKPFWEKLQTNDNFQNCSRRLKLYKQYRGEQALEKWNDKRMFPELLQFEYYCIINEVLKSGLRNCGDTISIVDVIHIIWNGCGTADDNVDAEFGINGDVAWYLNHRGNDYD
ncbi:Tti1 protein [Saccharomycopsis crataegensis]|uniref:Tti1 protein n=1 Tax=Saccharomycopsis crataegensis TaxID=43959 RepID=A0AAV5QGZ1_9ASCO|nr:Tti1 protein [Saccharomycopsis crataegensis]